ncbi:MAG: hypothetical protein EXQ81_11245 [Thermoleophilia bacterium]|nr:hypothetical protein [Thermoleophilia bacterium]
MRAKLGLNARGHHEHGRGTSTNRRPPPAARWALGIVLCVAGVGHLTARRVAFQAQVPYRTAGSWPVVGGGEERSITTATHHTRTPGATVSG